MKYVCALLSLLLFFSLGIRSAEAAVSNRPINWGFEKSRNHQSAEPGQPLRDLLKKHDAFYMGDPTQKYIYLTFDNGYENGYTASVLDVLKKRKVPAAFFVTGHYLLDQPQLVKRMAAEGHIVGNHSWHHPDLTKVSDERLRKELDSVRVKTEELTGYQGLNYLRPPRGVFSERVLSLSKELGYQPVFWSLAFVDWHTNAQKGWRYSYDQIMAQIHPGCILLLHTVSKDNAEALDQAIEDLTKQGYIFKSLDDLMIDRTFHQPFFYSL
ncbi:delta-lactam-biosynthetic de-N-acetylase [Bacillus sp. UMB0893]|uniref:delta-lactam-biosynthetic de-N-acetylase n=1 Tax=Bacillus sp. UMB0893 TaxID=2066053 RepID=UPI00215288B5|nr:delta-lactam-biosynthetic de-N-acetylase [Bacillus sp. UMB0893]